jgi:hypothetical protein
VIVRTVDGMGRQLDPDRDPAPRVVRVYLLRPGRGGGRRVVLSAEDHRRIEDRDA